MAPTPGREDHRDERFLRAAPARPHRHRLPPRREPQHADARRRTAALRATRGRGRGLRARDLRALARRGEIDPLFLRRPHRSLTAAGAMVWVPDERFDPEHHVRHSALPQPGRVRELLELCSAACTAPAWPGSGRCGRPTSSRGSRDGRVALYTKVHHALLDGVSAMRLMAERLSTDPDERGMEAAARLGRERARRAASEPAPARDCSRRHPADRAALRARHEPPRPPGCRGALVRTITKGVRNETSAVSLHAPRTLFNQTITGSRRFAAQDWPVERLRGDLQRHRHHDQRRRAGDVQRRDAHLPARARRAAGDARWSRWCRSGLTPSSRSLASTRAATRSAR